MLFAYSPFNFVDKKWGVLFSGEKGIKNFCYFRFFHVEGRAKCIEKCTFGSGGVNPA